MELTSTSNEKVKYWQKLKQKKYRDIEKLFLIEDSHLVDIALSKNIVKEIITVEDKEYDVPTYKVNEKIMKVLSSQVTSSKVIAVCNLLEEKEVEGNVLILDNIQDPGNLGTMIRSAAAFNFKTIILSDNSVSLYNDKVIRASEGMLFNVNVLRRNLLDFLPTINKEYKLVTTNVVNGKNIKDINYEKIALVIGNEGKGVSKEVAELCDETVKINMEDNCESLNAGVCASILMYEVYHG